VILYEECSRSPLLAWGALEPFSRRTCSPPGAIEWFPARSPVDRVRVEGTYGVIEAVPHCITEPFSLGPFDWVLLAVKSQDTPTAAPWLNRLCTGSTRVAVLQNGVDQTRRVSPYCTPAQVVPTVVYANGRKIAAHHIRHLCPGDDLIAPNDDNGRALASLFEGSLLRVRTEADFVTASWQKYLANLVANPLTALTNRNIEVLRGGEMEQLALGILREAAQIGRALGAKLPEDAAEHTMAWMSRYPGDTGTSMLQDRRDGRPLELDALTGTVIRLGVEMHIPTPMNCAIRALLTSMF
jgi:2-dehydropantoate 2-reductase